MRIERKRRKRKNVPGQNLEDVLIAGVVRVEEEKVGVGKTMVENL